jgi:hypothetical protein
MLDGRVCLHRGVRLGVSSRLCTYRSAFATGRTRPTITAMNRSLTVHQPTARSPEAAGRDASPKALTSVRLSVGDGEALTQSWYGYTNGAYPPYGHGQHHTSARTRVALKDPTTNLVRF